MAPQDERERDLAILRAAEALAKHLREKLGLPEAGAREKKRAERVRGNLQTGAR